MPKGLIEMECDHFASIFALVLNYGICSLKYSPIVITNQLRKFKEAESTIQAYYMMQSCKMALRNLKDF